MPSSISGTPLDPTRSTPYRTPSPDNTSTPQASTASTFIGDRIQRAAQPTNALADTLDSIAGDIGAAAKGIDANQTLPQRFRLIPVNPSSPHANNTAHAAIIDMEHPVEKYRGFMKNSKITGRHTVRFDRPHAFDGKMLGHHLNADTLPKNIADPHIGVPPLAVEGARNLARGLESAGRLARPAALMTDAVRLGNAVLHDGGRIGTRTISTGAEIAGGWAGAYAGGILGAETGGVLGAEIGTAVEPGTGTEIGGAIGGVLGGLSGSVSGGFAGATLSASLVGSAK